MSDENESNLVQRREDRRTLEKMRRKLATSGTVGKMSEQPRQNLQAKQGKRGMRIWPFAIGAAGVLIALNFGLSNQDTLLKALGIESESKNQPKAPPGLSLDEQTRFWAYAIYDIPKLRARFSVPRGAAIDKKFARTQLENLLADNLGNEVRNEVFVMQQKDIVPKANPKPVRSKKANGK